MRKLWRSDMVICIGKCFVLVIMIIILNPSVLRGFLDFSDFSWILKYKLLSYLMYLIISTFEILKIVCLHLHSKYVQHWTSPHTSTILPVASRGCPLPSAFVSPCGKQSFFAIKNDHITWWSDYCFYKMAKAIKISALLKPLQVWMHHATFLIDCKSNNINTIMRLMSSLSWVTFSGRLFTTEIDWAIKWSMKIEQMIMVSWNYFDSRLCSI